MSYVDELYLMRDETYSMGLQNLISYINNFGDTSKMTMIEIGSYAGESTEMFSKYFKNVVAIDPFMNDYDLNDVTCQYMELTKVYDTFKERIEKYNNIEHIRKTSDDAILELRGTSFDFVYIDGLHTYNQVNRDIWNYLPLIKKGGFIGGHDYHPVYQPVKNAVIEVFGQPDKTFEDTSWIKIIK
jgi:hypothetical protein